jgi:hypothetical protein
LSFGVDAMRLNLPSGKNHTDESGTDNLTWRIPVRIAEGSD